MYRTFFKLVVFVKQNRRFFMSHPNDAALELLRNKQWFGFLTQFVRVACLTFG
jgi:hypothetical protein